MDHLKNNDYEIILADPPWRYAFSASKKRKIENHYPTMRLHEILRLPVPEIVADDALLLLWATAPKLPEALAVLGAWGFEYKTSAVWDKKRIGLGYYFRGRHEHVLVGRRGKFPTPPPSLRPPSVIEAPRGRHSAKPIELYEHVERMYPNARKIELFARRQRPGWQVWGNEV